MTTNPLSQVAPWDIVAEGYAQETQPMFEAWALESFEKLAINNEKTVIDIACGPGTVSLLLADKVKSITALDFSEEMLKVFRSQLGRFTNISLQQCDCQKLPLKDSLFDIAISQFGLMFFPDRAAGFSEIYRVLKPNGEAIVSSWAPIEQSSALQLMIGALFTAFPEVKPKEEPKSIQKGLDDPDQFRYEMKQAGFHSIEIQPSTKSISVANAEDFWQTMVKGSAPITMMKAEKSQEEWQEGENRALEYVKKELEGVKNLSSTAYIGYGRK